MAWKGDRMLWTNSLETGIAKIDEQHKELFRQVDILMDNSNKSRIPETLKFLGDYVVQHFTDEQTMHSVTRYPKAEMHRKYHDTFIGEFKKLKNEFDVSGQNLATLIKLNHAVVNWLKDHIMIHDKDFATYYKTK
jgi:hemerythrin